MTVVLAVTGWGARKPGDPLKPGFNLLTPANDVQIGQDTSATA